MTEKMTQGVNDQTLGQRWTTLVGTAPAHIPDTSDDDFSRASMPRKLKAVEVTEKFDRTYDGKIEKGQDS